MREKFVLITGYVLFGCDYSLAVLFVLVEVQVGF